MSKTSKKRRHPKRKVSMVPQGRKGKGKRGGHGIPRPPKDKSKPQ